MKKLLAALILGALLVSVGVGCGGPTTSKAKPADTGDTTKPKPGG